MSRRSTATATRRPPTASPGADNGQTHSFLPEEVAKFLLEGGWLTNDPNPSTATLWAHTSKGGGHPLPSEQAYVIEKGARDAAGVATVDDAETEDATAERLASEQAASDGEAARRAAAEQARLDEARAAESQALLRRLAAAEAAAAEAAAPDPEFVHDQIGPVSLWRCYACKFETRYAETCSCGTCVHIKAAESCPNCGDEQPNIDPRRR